MSKLVGFATFTVLAAVAQVACSPAAPGPAASNSTPDGGGDSDAGAVVQSTCIAPTGAPVTHEGEIKVDETWSADSVHLIPHDFNILAKVTIAPCAQVQIGGGATVTVGASGSVYARGEASQPITIGAQDATKPWSMIRAIDSTIDLAYATVSDGGQPASNAVPDTVGAFMMQSTSGDGLIPMLRVDHVTIQGSRSNGVVLMGAGFSPDSKALTITKAAQFPMRIGAATIGRVPAGTYTGNGTDAILVIGGVGTGLSITEDETVMNHGVPYQLGDGQASAELRVGNGGPLATLTIEAGVTMAFKKGGGLFVEFASSTNPASGALVANGLPAKPITFTSAEAAPAAGDWVGVAFNGTPSQTDKLDYVVIEYAGGDSSTIAGCPLNTKVSAGLLLLGGKPSASFLTNSTIKSSARDAVFRGWIGADIDFTSSNTFRDIPGCHETNVLVQQGVCPMTACQ